MKRAVLQFVIAPRPGPGELARMEYRNIVRYNQTSFLCKQNGRVLNPAQLIVRILHTLVFKFTTLKEQIPKLLVARDEAAAAKEADKTARSQQVTRDYQLDRECNRG